jgi:hypothetical protein
MDLDKDVYYGFIIMLVLVLVVYYIGTTSVGQTLYTGIVQIVYALTGRTNTGNFAAYPGGATATTAGG